MSYATKTSLRLRILSIKKTLQNFLTNRLTSVGVQILNTLIGFFAATALSTIPTQQGDWSIVAATIIIVNQEIISKIIYQYIQPNYSRSNSYLNIFIKNCNNIKVGILYGLFVDAFKLGS